MMTEQIKEYFQNLQDQICAGLEKLDGTGVFQEDKWVRAEGGGGRSRVISGDLIEKGGVNWSAVHGEMPEMLKKNLNETGEFLATGVSIVLHPRSPMVPIIHMNVRYFETSNGTWWFGGGIDLTPHYVVEADARYFHRELKRVCDKHHPEYYDTFKPWADRYFYLKHRQETRGIGGIFYDHLQAEEGITKADRFAFTRDVGELFVPVYSQIANNNRELPFGEAEKDWQMIRRGRYVEFNLVWDRGTKFGLETNGRTESILMSMPPQANWYYNQTPPAGSKEANTLNWLKQGIDWV